jgi:hypothetical protein
MADPSARNVTRLLLAWRAWADSALNRLIPLVHHHLRLLAHCWLQEEDPGRTLETIAVVNETCPRLMDARQVAWRDRARFCGPCARMMRRTLVDAAQGSAQTGRGSPDRAAGGLAGGRAGAQTGLLLALDDVLKEPGKDEPRAN